METRRAGAEERGVKVRAERACASDEAAIAGVPLCNNSNTGEKLLLPCLPFVPGPALDKAPYPGAHIPG